MKKTISRIIGLAILVGIPLGVLYITRKPVQPATVEVEQVSGNTATNNLIIVRMHGIKASVVK